jgi:hypothetical protein
MITYIASYPRSGNTWFRHILLSNFGLLSTSVHLGRQGKHIFRNLTHLEESLISDWKKWEADNQRLLESLENASVEEVASTIENLEIFSRWFTPIKIELPTRQKRVLHFGCNTLLSYPFIRKFIASLDELFIVKTHKRPYKMYFEGEKVVQIIRNPGAVFVSFKNYLLTYRNKDIPYEKVIKGNVPFGNWSTYMSEWTRTATDLKSNYHSFFFEDMKSDVRPILKITEDFLDFPLIAEGEVDFEGLREKNPDFYRSGKIEGWESNYTTKQLSLIWKEHKKNMIALGYPKPETHPY